MLVPATFKGQVPVSRLLPANFLNHTLKAADGKGYSLSVGFLYQEEGAPLPAQILAGQAGAELQRSTILFIPLSAPPHKLEADWAASCAEVILRRCPACEHDSIIGHGRRRKQAHDEYHDWIGIRRGRCPGCGKTFTFLPLFCLPYTHYSLPARCQALRRRFAEHCSWEEAVPTLRDPNRLPDPSTLGDGGTEMPHAQRYEGRFFGRRVNCEQVPLLPAWAVAQAFDDPKETPYLLVWKDSAGTVWERTPLCWR